MYFKPQTGYTIPNVISPLLRRGNNNITYYAGHGLIMELSKQSGPTEKDWRIQVPGRIHDSSVLSSQARQTDYSAPL